MQLAVAAINCAGFGDQLDVHRLMSVQMLARKAG